MLFKRWDARASTGETNDFLTKLALEHIGEISYSPARLYLRDHLDRGDYAGLCNYDIPFAEVSAVDVIHISQVLAFFSKRQDLDFGVNRQEAAVEKFIAAERKCQETNDIFRQWQRGNFRFRPSVERILFYAQQKIARVLGDVPSLEELHFRFGPGATTQLPKKLACAKLKLSQRLACSGDMAPIISNVLETLPHLLPEGDVVTVSVEIHPGKLVTVPKNAKTDRTVMIEPWLNSFVQLGVGQYITRRLRAAGVDITDQSKNKSLARIGSIDGSLATLDLSSASDTISVGLVEHLLPPDWFQFLSCLRTSSVEGVAGKMVLQKFSSMGNGFTFPLETLVFWALASSASKVSRSVSVYGDDIIVKTEDVLAVMSVLHACGFEVNREKSFWSGPFRESCGGDYFAGIDVRPCYIKDRMSGADAFRLHNFYFERLETALAEKVKEHIHPNIRIYGPKDYGHGHLWATEWAPRKSKKLLARQWGGHLFDTFTFVKRKFTAKVEGDRVLPCYSIYCRESDMDIDRLDLTFIRQTPSREYKKDGTPVDNLPGVRGCKRITIYTLGL